MTEDQNRLVNKLVRATKATPSFEFEGLIVSGDAIDVAREYAKLNPSTKFRTWIIDNGLVLSEIDTSPPEYDPEDKYRDDLASWNERFSGDDY